MPQGKKKMFSESICEQEEAVLFIGFIAQGYFKVVMIHIFVSKGKYVFV